MAKLIETSKAGEEAAWACSECGDIIPVPSTGTTTEEKGDLHIEAFNRHVATAHKKPLRTAPPHLIADGNLQRCSACSYPFPPDVEPSLTVAFTHHLIETHKLAK